MGPGRASWRMLWAFKVAKSGKQPRDRFPTSQSQPGPYKTRKRHFFPLFTSHCCCFCKYHSSRQRLGSHGATATLQAFSFVTATNDASACGFVGIGVYARVSLQDPTAVGARNSLKNRDAIQLLFLFFIFATLSAAALLLCACITP